MITLIRNNSNEIVVTVTEKTTLDSPHYLFAFTSDDTSETFTCICENISANTARYDRFVVNEQPFDADGTAGQITLNQEGGYSYTIYEQESDTNLDTALAGNIVEQGKARVTGAAITDEAYEPETTTHKVYNG